MTDDRSSVGGEATLDEAFSLLSNRRRRFVLYYLADEAAAAVGTVADAVAAREAALEGVDDRDERRRRVAASLHHVHLPKLAAAGVVAYDPDRGVVRYAADETIDPWLARARRADGE